MKRFAVIVAGGSGTRMGAPVAKQYLSIGGMPILMHTLRKFQVADPNIKLVLVLPQSDHGFWKKICEEHSFSIPHSLVAGGSSRFLSVKNGLDAIGEKEGLVAIHDGVRPFVSKEIIEASFEMAASRGSGIVVVPLKDSIRKVDANGASKFEKRDQFRLVQTPQTFQLAKIKVAFEVEESSDFTDDATVYEHQGWQVALVEGDPSNIKITTPEDMDFAEFLLSRSKPFTE
ncbi:2-C-methyl-D-erythritol 4-phosphate cytidylyltransferase [Litoribacter alkaliphilus]|uniref:2-C-methyl-D-erythritol 4-phosphate cytidylyltransferase n=1 Tax=Litoribacter ruber TaxID=702568 RepID=A0AAP2CIT7_9BACT|nr:2-C-methyl-D-erythritol 4-phosphate cytidylyltransferase [Litoribacter alkaliphilus]MBS9524972.1 2-C-methyl-D-erythritol 4-phosphate cytidylyltransferase [Litoribacter alkaliphilus]